MGFGGWLDDVVFEFVIGLVMLCWGWVQFILYMLVVYYALFGCLVVVCLVGWVGWLLVLGFRFVICCCVSLVVGFDSDICLLFVGGLLGLNVLDWVWVDFVFVRLGGLWVGLGCLGCLCV